MRSTTAEHGPTTTTGQRGPAVTRTMRAIVQDGYGAADVLRLDRIAAPAIADDEVLVRVHAAGLDRGTWHLMTGKPYLIRIGVRHPPAEEPGPGLDVAGTVVAVGSAVTRFPPATRCSASAAAPSPSTPSAREDKLARKPANLTFEQAAVVPVSALTALQAVCDAGRVEPGSRCWSSAPPAASAATPCSWPRPLGAEVTGVCSTAKVDLVRSLGADHVIDYTREDFADGAHRYDLILDIGGNSVAVPAAARAHAHAAPSSSSAARAPGT